MNSHLRDKNQLKALAITESLNNAVVFAIC